MAQRRILGLFRSMALLLGRRFQTEEERAGPSDTGDLSRYLRERAASGRSEAADCFFLSPIPERFDQQVAANPARSIRFEEVAPGLVQLFRAEVSEIFDLRREALDVR